MRQRTAGPRRRGIAWGLALAVCCMTVPQAGCGGSDEVLIEQRHTETLPGLDGKVKVWVGDVKSGTEADVKIFGPGSTEIAARAGARVGDRIPFTYEGKRYELEVTRYTDEVVGNDDYAWFRLIPPAEQ